MLNFDDTTTTNMNKIIPAISGIYIIINTINNHKYIGSSKNIFLRWMEHKRLLRKNKNCCKGLQSAWNKYGEQSFSFEVLRMCKRGSLLEFEQQYFDLLKPEYNMLSVAKSLPTMKGKKHSIETKKRMSASGKKSWTEERRKTASLMVGELNPTYGSKHTDEFKKKRKETMIKMWTNDDFRKNQIEKRTGKNKPNMVGKLAGDKNPMYGMSGDKSPCWGRKLSKEHIDKFCFSTRRKIKQIDVVSGSIISEYVSITEAAMQIMGTKKATGNIVSCAKGILKSAYGYKWSY